MTEYHWVRPLSVQKKIRACALGTALAVGVALPVLAVAAGLNTAPLNTSTQPANVEQVGSMTAPQDLGRVVSDQAQTISVYLNLHNQAGFDQAVSALYDPRLRRSIIGSPTRTLPNTLRRPRNCRRCGPSWNARGLKTVSVDPLNFSIRVRGNTTAIESAFHTELHTLSYGKSVVQIPTSEPKLAGSAGDLVAATVGGRAPPDTSSIGDRQKPADGVNRCLKKPSRWLSRRPGFSEIPSPGRRSPRLRAF